MLQEHTDYGKIRMILQYRKNSEYRKELKKKKGKKVGERKDNFF